VQTEQDAHAKLRSFPEELEQAVCVLTHGATGGMEPLTNEILVALDAL